MRYIYLVILHLFFFFSCLAQTKPIYPSQYSKAISKQARIMGKLLLKKDFKSFSKYTYPKVVEMMGGKKKMIEVLKEGLKEMESNGTKILSVTIGEPSQIVAIENELQCTVPETLKLKVQNGTLITISTLIAISIDNGKNWYFVDTSGEDIQSMKKNLPNLSLDLVIPEKVAPIFYKD